MRASIESHFDYLDKRKVMDKEIMEKFVRLVNVHMPGVMDDVMKDPKGKQRIIQMVIGLFEMDKDPAIPKGDALKDFVTQEINKSFKINKHIKETENN